MTMNAQQLVHKAILEKAIHFGHIEPQRLSLFTPDEIDELYEESLEDGLLQDATNEIRYGEVDTNLSATTHSRHYEIDVKAMKIDGVWVAWDYYYGGGKHGEPEAFDWISNARIVDCEEVEVKRTEYIFSELP